MSAFVREHAVFLAYWGAVLLLCTIEYVAPQLPDRADRNRRWFANFGLGLLNALIASSVPAATVASAWWAHREHFGLLNLFAVPWWTALIVTVLVRSLSQYALHVTSHKMPLLWRLHRVHHSDVHLDASSALRNHPLEVFVSVAFYALVIAIFGLSPVVLAVFETADLFVNLLTHANVRIPDTVEHLLRLVFVTPHLHRLHHSPHQIETDSNYGNFFSFWDRAFGTYRGETIQAGPALRFGLDDVSDEHAKDLQAQLALPWSSPTRG